LLDTALLDTDVFSALMRQQPQVVARAQEYLSTHERLTISIITQYEILRGLKSRGASAQLATFEELCDSIEIVELSGSVVARAAEIYADLHRRGEVIGDADILIAATAIEHDLILVSNNQAHFSRIVGIRLENWIS
jgi:tRNA(fMet)-specific endonuclease VapC